jgi:hypothetical protein
MHTENAVISMSVYRNHIEQLFEVLKRAADGLRIANIEYRLVGGLAVFFHVDARDPMAARFTRDIDLAINRRDLDSIRAALEPLGFVYRHVASVDMLLNLDKPKVSSAIHLVFLDEKVRPDYLEPVPNSPAVTDLAEGIALAPVSDLVLMKLTSFHEKDRVHIRDMDSAGLITPGIEAALRPEFQSRLQQVRATE